MLPAGKNVLWFAKVFHERIFHAVSGNDTQSNSAKLFADRTTAISAWTKTSPSLTPEENTIQMCLEFRLNKLYICASVTQKSLLFTTPNYIGVVKSPS